MINPADCMAGCMRGASDSRLNGDSGDGKRSEWVVTTVSICSIDDCIMLARVFNSAKESCEALQRRALSDTSTSTGAYWTYLALECWAVDVAGCEDMGAGSEMEKDTVGDERRTALKVDGISHCHVVS